MSPARLARLALYLHKSSWVEGGGPRIEACRTGLQVGFYICSMQVESLNDVEVRISIVLRRFRLVVNAQM